MQSLLRSHPASTAWQKEFDALGVKEVNVCEDKDGKLHTYAPYEVWLQKK